MRLEYTEGNWEMCKLSFVIPCYGSENTIEDVVQKIKNVMSQQATSYEIILVNDCSPDCVWDVIKKMASQQEHIMGINLTKNFGQHSALMAGYRFATGDIIVSMDDDGQTPIEEVGALINELEKGYDVVFAKYKTIKQNIFRRIGSKINERMTEYLINKPADIKPTSFFVAYRFIIEEMLRYNNAYPYIGGLIFRTTRNIANVEVEHHKRLQGASGYTLRKLIRMWFNGFMAFSVKPLRIATVLGFISAVFGVAFGVVTIIRKLFIPNIQMGYSSLLVSILFIGGVIMVLLGIIGEYVGRIYICMNNAPQYVIREVAMKNRERGKSDEKKSSFDSLLA